MWDAQKSYIDWLKQNKMEYTVIDSETVDRYRKEWFDRFVPLEQREEVLANCHCFPKAGYSGFLWHIFSCGLLGCDEGKDAIDGFNRAKKGEAILLPSLDDVAFQIKNTAGLKARDINKYFYDVILTSHDFSWVYVKTHEPEFGPYFYQR